MAVTSTIDGLISFAFKNEQIKTMECSRIILDWSNYAAEWVNLLWNEMKWRTHTYKDS